MITIQLPIISLFCFIAALFLLGLLSGAASSEHLNEWMETYERPEPDDFPPESRQSNNSTD